VPEAAEEDGQQVLPTEEAVDGAKESPGPVTVDNATWPDWLKMGINELNVVDGPDEFKAVIEKLVSLETLLGYPSGQVRFDPLTCRSPLIPFQGKSMFLSKTERPEAIGRWINSGRRTWQKVDDVPAFAKTWAKWWGSLQPKSRVLRGKPLQRSVDADEGWGELMKGSINGFFTVVMSLAWWWQGVKSAPQRKVWFEAVDDVRWVQDQMIMKLHGARKRGRDEKTTDGIEEGKRVKRYGAPKLPHLILIFVQLGRRGVPLEMIATDFHLEWVCIRET
jgi:hypothetical protein